MVAVVKEKFKYDDALDAFGITGMWQAYGRNSVMDFDEVVKMDLEYIDNWSILLDIKILFKTVATVFTNHGT